MAGLYDDTSGFSNGTGLYRGRLGLFSGASGLVNGTGSGGGAALPSDTASEIWFGDAVDYGKAAAPNLRASTSPTGNIFIYTSDQVRTQSGTSTITYNYDAAGGTRIQLTGASQSVTLMAASPPGSSTPVGQCTLGFQWMPTSGTQKLRFGQTPYTALGATVSATGGTFTQASVTGTYSSADSVVITALANSTIAAAPTGASRVSATSISTFTTTTAHSMIAGQSVVITSVTDTSFNGTFTIIDVPTTTTFTVSNSGADATSGSGTVAKPVDIIVKELQLYRGSSLPAYSSENWDYHFKSNWAIPDALSMTVGDKGLDNVTTNVARGAIVFPERTTYDEITVFIMANKSSELTTNSALLTPIYDPDTGAAVGSSDFNMAAKVTTGVFYAAPESALKESGQVTMQAAGTQIYAFRGSVTQVTTYLNELQFMQTEAGTGGWPSANTISAVGVPGASRVSATSISTFTTTTAHGMIAGQRAIVSGVTDATFNGTYTVATVPTTTTFTVTNPGDDATSGAGRVDKPVSLRGFWLGSYAATRNQSPTASLFDGSYYMFAMVPRALSDAEMLSSMSYIRTEATSRGIDLTALSDITITPGDSLTEWITAVFSWPWVLAADTGISPRMQLKNCANGGSSFNGITIGQPEAFGTVLVNEVIPAIQACDAMSTTPIVMLMDGTNDYAYLSTLAGSAPPDTVPGWINAKAGWENYRDIWWIPYMQAVRAASPNVKIIGIDTMPRGDTAATSVGFEANGRGPWNTWKRANFATYCDAYVSVAGTTLETFAGADAAGYFSADDLHLSTAGQAYLASLIKPVWESVR